MKSTTICFCLVLATRLAWADPELDQLKSFYDNEVERVTAPLRANYIKDLQKLLEHRTKAGELDEALKVRAELEKLEGPVSKEDRAMPSTAAALSQSDLEKLFVGKIWQTPTGTKFTFHQKGAGTREYGQDKSKVTWHYDGSNVIQVQDEGKGRGIWYFRFLSPTEGYYGGKMSEIKLKLKPL